MKKAVLILIMLLLVTLTSCDKKNEFFTESELENFGLINLEKPNNSSNYYNKSNNLMLMCYMNVYEDDDVRNFVLNIFDMLENSGIYEIYGYAKGDDMYKEHRNIYLSQNIDDFLVDTYNYAENSVSNNTYIIYYSLKNKEKNKIFELTITSYTTERSNLYLSEYNFYIVVTRNNASNYTIVK